VGPLMMLKVAIFLKLVAKFTHLTHNN